MLEATTSTVSARGWLATFHFVLAVLFLCGHIWHAIRARREEAGFDFKKGDMVMARGNPQLSDLSTPINSSDFTLKFLKNLPIYRQGLAPLSRGLEIGMAHGYWLIGPFAILGPLRNSEQANLAGLLAATVLIVILTICLSIYGTVSYEKKLQTLPRPSYVSTVPNVPESLQTTEGWSQFSVGFLVGGVGGATFAYLLLSNLSLLPKIIGNLG